METTFLLSRVRFSDLFACSSAESPALQTHTRLSVAGEEPVHHIFPLLKWVQQTNKKSRNCFSFLSVSQSLSYTVSDKSLLFLNLPIIFCITFCFSQPESRCQSSSHPCCRSVVSRRQLKTAHLVSAVNHLIWKTDAPVSPSFLTNKQ